MTQAAITVEGWQALAGAAVIVLTVVFKFIMDLRKDSRERDASNDRLQVLRDIASSNRDIREGQLRQNGKLSTVMTANEVYHAEILRLLSHCTATAIHPPVNQEQKEHT